MDDLVDISKNISMTFLYIFMVCQLPKMIMETLLHLKVAKIVPLQYYL